MEADGARTYIRCVSKDAVIHTKLICGKSKVVPMKVTTIPRLELQAAVLAVRMQANLAQEKSIMFDKTYFSTYRKFVLGYIHNESCRFHVYVANMINVIREASYPNQWHHVSGAENPADVLSRKCIGRLKISGHRGYQAGMFPVNILKLNIIAVMLWFERLKFTLLMHSMSIFLVGPNLNVLWDGC